MTPSSYRLISRRVVTENRVGPGSVRVADGRIVEVLLASRGGGTPQLAPHSQTDIDLGDLVLMPGLVDTHVHINEPGRTDWEGFRSGGRAAAAGGITTMVVMPLNCSPAATNADALRAEAQAAANACAVDYGFWGGLVPGNTQDLKPMRDAGALGFKCFMVDSGIDDFGHVSKHDLLNAAPVLAQLKVPLLAHAEDPAIIETVRTAAGLSESPRSYARYLASRPPQAERKAISALIDVCRSHKLRTHIVHLADGGSLPQLADARTRRLPITVETCPHYLTFTAEGIPDGATQFKCAPPIRDAANRHALWQGMQNGTIDLIVSDHSPCPPQMKHAEAGDFVRAWGGIASLQLGLPAVWTQARRRGFGLPDVARWMCQAPAALAGISDQKGRIAVGLDADFVIWDARKSWTVRGAALHHRHPLTPYDGLVLYGAVERTILRGQTIYDAASTNPFVMGPTGRWIKREPA